MGLLNKLALGAADTTIAGAGGGMIGTAASMGSPENLPQNAAMGAAIGVGGMGAMGLKRAIQALAAQLKKARPDLPDDQILMAAQKAVQMKMGGGQ